jgi:hypothetical protein
MLDLPQRPARGGVIGIDHPHRPRGSVDHQALADHVLPESSLRQRRFDPGTEASKGRGGVGRLLGGEVRGGGHARSLARRGKIFSTLF